MRSSFVNRLPRRSLGEDGSIANRQSPCRLPQLVRSRPQIHRMHLRRIMPHQLHRHTLTHPISMQHRHHRSAEAMESLTMPGTPLPLATTRQQPDTMQPHQLSQPERRLSIRINAKRNRILRHGIIARVNSDKSRKVAQPVAQFSRTELPLLTTTPPHKSSKINKRRY